MYLLFFKNPQPFLKVILEKQKMEVECTSVPLPITSGCFCNWLCNYLTRKGGRHKRMLTLQLQEEGRSSSAGA